MYCLTVKYPASVTFVMSVPSLRDLCDHCKNMCVYHILSNTYVCVHVCLQICIDEIIKSPCRGDFYVWEVYYVFF